MTGVTTRWERHLAETRRAERAFVDPRQTLLDDRDAE
jgi:hypothetical protein